VRRGILPNAAVRTTEQAAPEPPSPHAVFGIELATVLARPDSRDGIPHVLTALMEKLRADGLRVEGIFRVPGDATEMQELRRRINTGDDPVGVLHGCASPHSVAGILKFFYREIRPPLLSFSLYDDFIAYASRIGTPCCDDFDARELRALLRRLPAGHEALLAHLVSFLNEVVQFTSESKMTIGNIAAVFAPNLLRPEHETLEHLADTAHIVNLTAVFITHARAIFGRSMMAPLSSERSSSQTLHLSASASTSTLRSCPSDIVPLEASASALTPVSGTPSRLEAPTWRENVEALAEAHLAPQRPPGREWFWVDRANAQQGPVGWSELLAMLSAGQIDADTYLFSAGMDDWKCLDLSGPEPSA